MFRCIRTLLVQMRLSASEADLPVRDIMGNCGQSDNAAGEKFPGAGQRQFRETFPFLVMLHPGARGGWGDARSASHNALDSESLVTFLLTPQKMSEKRLPGCPLRPRPSLTQHQPLITVIRSARMSETAPILDTDLQAGWTMLF